MVAAAGAETLALALGVTVAAGVPLPLVLPFVLVAPPAPLAVEAAAPVTPGGGALAKWLYICMRLVSIWAGSK